MTTLYNWREQNRTPMSKARKFKAEKLVGDQWVEVDWKDRQGNVQRFPSIGEARWAIRRQSAEDSLDSKPEVQYRVVPVEEEP